MKWHWFWLLAFLGLILHAMTFAGEATKTDVLKGTVTIGGRPTADAVASVEGLPQEKLKTQNSKLPKR